MRRRESRAYLEGTNVKEKKSCAGEGVRRRRPQARAGSKLSVWMRVWRGGRGRRKEENGEWRVESGEWRVESKVEKG